MRRQHDEAERVWNPYSWRLYAIADLGDDPSAAALRQELTDQLICAEAAEIARGIHHVSVVHGDPTTVAEAECLSTFLSQAAAVAAGAEWSRHRGDNGHMIMALSGPGAAERTDHIVGLAARSNPGHWTITDSARPDLTLLL